MAAGLGLGLSLLYLPNGKGFGLNHKRVYRIYWKLKLDMCIKLRKQLVREKAEPLAVLSGINYARSVNFMRHRLADGRSYKLFHVIDECNREGLGIEVHLSLPALHVACAPDQIIDW